MDMRMLDKGFFTGINYWASKNAMNMWHDFDEASVERDMVELKNVGVTCLRVFPLWHDFQPLTAIHQTDGAYEYRFGEDVRPDTEAGEAGVSEEACVLFEKFCALAEKHGLTLIVAMITGQMSSRMYAPPAFLGKDYLADPTVIKWQLRFVKYFVNRMKSQKCIVGWDLGNEVNTMFDAKRNHADQFYVWSAGIANQIRACDPGRPVVSGIDRSGIETDPSNYKTIGEFCDVHTTHPYNIFLTQQHPVRSAAPILDLPFKCRLGEDISKVPTFVQEFGAIGYQTCSYRAEAEFYRACMFASLFHGCHGVMYWCAFDQGHLNMTPYSWNNIGSDYGFFDKDMQAKPIAEENAAFHSVLAKLPGAELPKHKTDAVMLIPRDDGGTSLDALRAAYMLAKRANFDVSFSYAMDAIPDSPLYILPSLNTNRTLPKHRLDALLEKVENGAVLYVSMGEALFRRFPELFGLTIASRRVEKRERKLQLNGETLPVTSNATLIAEDTTNCTVLARDENGIPMFTEHDFGKGKVFLLTAPLEDDLATRAEPFWCDAPAKYEMVYETLAAAANVQRMAKVDNAHITLTEHPTEDGAYVCALNCTDKAQSGKITLPEGVKLVAVHGELPVDGVLTLGACDGAIFRVEK